MYKHYKYIEKHIRKMKINFVLNINAK